jgi:hypothetical protein
MIKFALACERGHGFESWFPDGASYDEQARRGFVQCPECDSRRVTKAPIILGGKRAAERPQAVNPEASAPVALIDEKHRELRAALTAMRKLVESQTVDVGSKFPDIARAIHAGDEPERAIRGQATLAEAKALIEEGVGVMPLPTLPDDAN